MWLFIPEKSCMVKVWFRPIAANWDDVSALQRQDVAMLPPIALRSLRSTAGFSMLCYLSCFITETAMAWFHSSPSLGICDRCFFGDAVDVPPHVPIGTSGCCLCILIYMSISMQCCCSMRLCVFDVISAPWSNHYFTVAHRNGPTLWCGLLGCLCCMVVSFYSTFFNSFHLISYTAALMPHGNPGGFRLFPSRPQFRGLERQSVQLWVAFLRDLQWFYSFSWQRKTTGLSKPFFSCFLPQFLAQNMAWLRPSQLCSGAMPPVSRR